MDNSKVLKILLVEDDSTIGQLLKVGMRSLKMPYTLDHAFSAEEGIELWKQHQYNLIMTDFHLRGKNGLELVSAVRSTNQNVPIILFTAYESSQVRRQAESLGISAFIAKPFFVDQFIETVHGLLAPHTREYGSTAD